ncbi:MAG: thymidylate synthase [Crenarchaeota archaeon]|nr:MAG: thymidylate synthase [Thermoproteota archaeon]
MYVLEAYDNCLKQILKHGVLKKNRTGVDTIAIFGMQSRYRIDTHFPVLTGRKVWPKAIFAELLWFLSGSTCNKDLQELGSNIWTPWVDAEFEKKHGYAEGCFGPVYGFQLRHFGGFYGNGLGGQPNTQDKLTTISKWPHFGRIVRENRYGKDGFDQLAYMVERLKNKPNCRRNLFSLWNPKELSAMRLPPCHYTFQVFTHENKLSGMLTQRSCDFPVGIPANIQFYSALIYMLAQQCGYEPYEFVHTTADSHIYVDQTEAVEEYLSREKPASPKLELNKAKDIYSYQLSDFKLVNYNPLSKIEIPVAV